MRELTQFYFIKKGKKNEHKESAIYGRINYHDSKTSFFTGIYIKPADWEKTKQLTKPKTEDEEVKMAEKNKWTTKIRNTKSLLELQGRKITAQIIKDIILEKKSLIEEEGPKVSLKTAMKELIQEKVGLVKVGRRSDGTLTKYYTTEKHLDSFLQSHLGIKDIALIDLNYKFVKDFYHYLIHDKIVNGIVQKGICNNTSQKYIQTLRCTVFHAIKMDYLMKDPFKAYDYEWDKVNTVYLTKAELEQIENHVFVNKRLDVVRDIFLFTCYTGFAPVDLKYISWDNLELRDNNRYWFVMNRKKSDGLSEVMMFQKTKALIDKYKDDAYCKANNLLLPLRANQTMNEYLKEIASHVGIVKRLTHYVGRHTFATTVMLSNGASLETVKRALGHARVTQTEHYAKIVAEKITAEMELVDRNLQVSEVPKINYEELAKKRISMKELPLSNENTEPKIISISDFSQKVNEERSMIHTRKKLNGQRRG